MDDDSGIDWKLVAFETNFKIAADRMYTTSMNIENFHPWMLEHNSDNLIQERDRKDIEVVALKSRVWDLQDFITRIYLEAIGVSVEWHENTTGIELSDPRQDKTSAGEMTEIILKLLREEKNENR